MARNRINMILDIHQSCTRPIYKVLEKITSEQFNWKPAPDSRSINEIVCHLIRVDNYFLKRLNQQAKTDDPKNGTAQDVLDAYTKVALQVNDLVKNCNDDSELFTKSEFKEAKDIDTINYHVLHTCQHHLYHLAQIIYLRRALDRKWEVPQNAWDKATRVIADYLSPVAEE